MLLAVVAADVAMRSALARVGAGAADGRFPRHYDLGPSMPFAVIMDHEHGWTFLGIFFAFVLVLAAASLAAAGALRRCGPRAPALFVIGLVVLVGAMTTVPVTFSLDPYAYVAFGRLLALYGQNPYLHHDVLAASSHDSVLGPLAAFLGTPLPDDNYGPLWNVLSAALAGLGVSMPLSFNVWLQRAAAGIALVVAAGAILYLRRQDEPAVRASSVARFALHPLALYESAAAGHNDMLMLAPALWAFALVARAPLLAGVLIGAAISIKYVALLAYPFLAFYAWRNGGLRAALSFKLAAIATVIVCFVPLWPGWSNLAPILGLGSTLIMSPMWLAAMWLPFASAKAIAVTFAIAFIAVLVYSVWQYGRDRRPEHVFRSTAALLWASPLLNPWYVQWLLPASATAGRWARYAWWFGLLVFLRYIEDALRFPSTQTDMASRIALLSVTTVVILIVPILASSDTIDKRLHRRGATGDA